MTDRQILIPSRPCTHPGTPSGAGSGRVRSHVGGADHIRWNRVRIVWKHMSSRRNLARRQLEADMETDVLAILKVAKCIGVVLAAGAAGYSLFARSTSDKHRRMTLMAWPILPPVFFYFEYFFQAPSLSDSELMRFKDLQGLASPVWAGVVAALSIAYFKKD